jgi:hypothetical protein
MASAALVKNNSFPKELLSDEKLSNSMHQPLRVISKLEWLEWKKKFKELSKLVSKNLSSSSYDPNLKSSDLNNSSLLQFKFTDRISESTNLVTKRDVKIAIMHYTTPAFVDLSPNAQTGIVRFFNQS